MVRALLVTTAVVSVPPLTEIAVTPPDIDVVTRPSAAVIVVRVPPETDVKVVPPALRTSVSTVAGMTAETQGRVTSISLLLNDEDAHDH